MMNVCAGCDKNRAVHNIWTVIAPDTILCDKCHTLYEIGSRFKDDIKGSLIDRICSLIDRVRKGK